MCRSVKSIVTSSLQVRVACQARRVLTKTVGRLFIQEAQTPTDYRTDDITSWCCINSPPHLSTQAIRRPQGKPSKGNHVQVNKIKTTGNWRIIFYLYLSFPTLSKQVKRMRQVSVRIKLDLTTAITSSNIISRDILTHFAFKMLASSPKPICMIFLFNMFTSPFRFRSSNKLNKTVS